MREAASYYVADSLRCMAMGGPPFSSSSASFASSCVPRFATSLLCLKLFFIYWILSLVVRRWFAFARDSSSSPPGCSAYAAAPYVPTASFGVSRTSLFSASPFISSCSSLPWPA